MIIVLGTQFHVYLLSRLNSVFNVKALVGVLNQEKALVGAFSVIVKTDCGTDGSFYSTNSDIDTIARPAPVNPSRQKQS